MQMLCRVALGDDEDGRVSSSALHVPQRIVIRATQIPEDPARQESRGIDDNKTLSISVLRDDGMIGTRRPSIVFAALVPDLSDDDELQHPNPACRSTGRGYSAASPIRRRKSSSPVHATAAAISSSIDFSAKSPWSSVKPTETSMPRARRVAVTASIRPRIRPSA